MGDDDESLRIGVDDAACLGFPRVFNFDHLLNSIGVIVSSSSIDTACRSLALGLVGDQPSTCHLIPTPFVLPKVDAESSQVSEMAPSSEMITSRLDEVMASS